MISMSIGMMEMIIRIKQQKQRRKKLPDVFPEKKSTCQIWRTRKMSTRMRMIWLWTDMRRKQSVRFPENQR